MNLEKTIFLKQVYAEIKVIWSNFQNESEAKDIEVKTLLRELARGREKINDDYSIDRNV